MLGLGEDAQLPQLVVQVVHEPLNPGLDGAEVVVFHFLSLGGLGTEEGAAGEEEILPLVVKGLVHQEVLLLRAHGGDDPGDVFVPEELQDPHGLLVKGFHGAEKRGLFIQRLAAVGVEDGGDA